jgi:hypothetical protein
VCVCVCLYVCVYLLRARAKNAGPGGIAESPGKFRQLA